MVRCRAVAIRDLIAVVILLLMVSVMVFWHMRSTCESSHSRQPCIITEQFKSSLDIGGFRNPSDNTPVYVVEEHHEVLKYWFQAAEKGLIAKKGNVLFHIDGHSDGGMPPHSDILTLFKWPTSKQVKAMMQKNDVFIVAAALTGLITRYIWVSPPWDVDLAADVGNAVKTVELGTMMRLSLDNELILDYCICIPAGLSDITEPMCFMKNLTEDATTAEPDPVEVGVDECNIQSRGSVEVVSEDTAIDMLYRGNWISPDDSIILDIDEDYYGVESAVQPLYDAGLDERTLTWPDFYVSRLFCSRDAAQETMADRFYHSLMQKIRNVRLYCTRLEGDNATNRCEEHPAMIETLMQFVPSMIEDLKRQEVLRSALCTQDESKLNTILGGLIRHSVKYTVPQLDALSQVGICHRCSVSSYDFESRYGMKLCDGYNKPNDSIVPFHMPSVEEINFRTVNLREILKDAYMTPGIVTVCRSTRDGYTPRSHFRQIENDVLNSLGDYVKGVDKDMVYYDPDLLGGRFGWHNRH
ncbi:uncharacterized protein LOC121378879 [Gigantopelta aegis]|uniref:uncharacterized protein LOC121378879 n=1 Tax=Gigantopelta aegis TaxID=1735272 RepID=UPI001B88DFDF|nr:uncharacterized protein LOC121378879 [Gigantopelta aegis]